MHGCFGRRKIFICKGVCLIYELYMVTVELNNIILHGHHGVYEEERKLVNTFEVNLSVSYKEKNTNFEGIGSTINYVELYEIVKQKMQAPGLLLEKICQGIIHLIKHRYAEVRAG